MILWAFGVQVTVILLHLFDPAELQEQADLEKELESDITSECGKMGPVQKVGRVASQLLYMKQRWSQGKLPMRDRSQPHGHLRFASMLVNQCLHDASAV